MCERANVQFLYISQSSYLCKQLKSNPAKGNAHLQRPTAAGTTQKSGSFFWKNRCGYQNSFTIRVRGNQFDLKTSHPGAEHRHTRLCRCHVACKYEMRPKKITKEMTDKPALASTQHVFPLSVSLSLSLSLSLPLSLSSLSLPLIKCTLRLPIK